MIISNLSDYYQDNIFLKLSEPLYDVHLKLEGFNISGSIKMRPAKRIIKLLESSSALKQGSTIIESSSGNLGIALSVLCAERGYNFICVTDANTNKNTENLIKAYNGKVVRIEKSDGNGGFLGQRIKYIKWFLSKFPETVWPNQYENLENIKAHYLTTANQIHQCFDRINYIFVGTGTTGTLGGISSYFRECSKATKIIAVEPEGSVTFGGNSKSRKIPGLGTSHPPSISKSSSFDDLIYIPEESAVSTCRKHAANGKLFGGSTGTVLAGIESYKHNFKPGDKIIAISPDFGERYLNTVYNDEWVHKHFRSLSTRKENTKDNNPDTKMNKLAEIT